MKIAIVNASGTALKLIKKALKKESGLEHAWSASDGKEAVEKAIEWPPDLILMDMIMPKMNGVEATKRIMEKSPCAILVVTEGIDGKSSYVFDAMGAGALDVAPAPTISSDGTIVGFGKLVNKILMIGKLINKINSKTKNNEIDDDFDPDLLPCLVAIGSSTGGPKALETILTSLPDEIPAAIIIAQHVDDQFVTGLIDWLSAKIKSEVKIAETGERPLAGKIYLSRADVHLFLDKNLRFAYSKEPKDYPYVPSINSFFESLADNWPCKEMAIILTGMGSDGADGLLQLKRKGWHTLAQDKESSAVYGMPKKAVEIGATKTTSGLKNISAEIMKFMNKRK